MEQIGQFILNHWVLWGALIVILLLILGNEFITQKRRAPELSPSEVVAKINHDEVDVIDLRDKEAFQAGHIINAISADFNDFEQPRMAQFKEKPFIIVCPRGLQSPAWAAKLREQGFSKVLVLAGGMNAWIGAQLPTVKGKTPLKSVKKDK